MELIFLTGMSGAGKSQAAKYLEDQGFFCMDNVPPYVLPDLCGGFIKGRGGEGFGVNKLAFVVDVRSQEFLEGFADAMAQIDENLGCPYKIIFLEASDSVLINRYQQTRRKHPLSSGMSLTEAIAQERTKLMNIKAMATNVIDTSMMTPMALCDQIKEMIIDDEDTGMSIFVESFGFKYGLPVDCDYVFDVRFLPNPFYVPELKNLTGIDDAIGKYLEGFAETKQFVVKACDLLEFTFPSYIREGKGRLHIGVGCTGGRHRSVYCAESIYRMLKDAGFKAVVHHRDIDKDSHRYKTATQGDSSK